MGYLNYASRTMIVSNTIFMALSLGSVVLRLWARKQKSIPLAADDYLNVAAWFFSALLTVTNIVGVPVGGFGVPFESLTPDKTVLYLKIFFILQFWYIIAVALVKLSVLCFYGRIFALGRWPLSVRIMIGLVVGWLISFLFATFFQIWPLECNWIVCNPTADYPAIYLMSSITDIILDVAILALPITFIKDLQMSMNQKIGIAGIFGLGIFCVVSSLARLVYTVDFVKANIVGDYASNFDVAVVNIIMWSGIEACASTICANLPCYRPLVGKARHIGFLRPLATYHSSHTMTPFGSKKKLTIHQTANDSVDNAERDGSTRYIIEGVRPDDNCGRSKLVTTPSTVEEELFDTLPRTEGGYK